MTEETMVVARNYTTRGTEKKLMRDAMAASKRKYVLKKRIRNIIVGEENIPKDQVISVEEEKEIIWTESEEDLGGLSQGPKVTKDPKAQKRVTIKEKMGDPAPTQGPGSQVKRRKVAKVFTRD